MTDSHVPGFRCEICKARIAASTLVAVLERQASPTIIICACGRSLARAKALALVARALRLRPAKPARRRKLYRTAAIWLRALVALGRGAHRGRVVRRLLASRGLTEAANCGDVAKLRWWGLIECPRSGIYQATDRGRSWVLGEIRVPECAIDGPHGVRLEGDLVSFADVVDVAAVPPIMRAADPGAALRVVEGGADVRSA